MQVATQPLEISDFSGGMTDNYINCPLNRGQLFNNVFILPNGKLRSRWGSDLDDDSANAQIPAGSQRIGALINYNNSDTLFVQSAKKIYYRNPSAYTTLVGPVTSNDVFNAGSTSSYISHTEWNRHLFVTNDSFAYVTKIYKDSGGTIRARTAGLPGLASAPSVAAGAAGARSYIYAFHHYYTYTIGSQVFEDRGPVTEVTLSNSAEPSGGTPNPITSIPVLANGATYNWETTAIKIHIFRTVNGGTELFKIGEVTNGTTTFSDTFSDATIDDNASIYTTGGVLDNDMPPLCKYVHVVNNVGYYAHIQENSETFPNSYRISVQFDPDSVPQAFEDEVEDEITGLSSVQSIPIVACKRHVYRSEGSFDETGRGSLTHIRISDHAGCISNLSMVQAEGNLYWAGNDGFYMTDGYRVQKISDHLNDTYATYISAMDNPKSIVGTFDEKYRRVMWTVQGDSASADNDTIVVLELRWGVSNEMTFTTMTGSTSFSPTSLVFFNKQMYRADHRGYVFVHQETLYTDRKFSSVLSAANWVTQTIIWNYLGPATSFGTTLGRKWVPKLVATLGNEGNVSVQINAINDDGRSARALKPIRYRTFTWGDPSFVWGSSSCVWGVSGIEEQWRRMPHGGLRLSYLQIQFTNAYVVVTNSDAMGDATVSNSANTATLGGSYVWGDAVDYKLSFEDDLYDTEFEISEVSTNVATFIDVDGVAPTGSYSWLLKGYPKGEVFSLQSYALLWSAGSLSHKTYEAADAAENA